MSITNIPQLSDRERRPLLRSPMGRATAAIVAGFGTLLFAGCGETTAGDDNGGVVVYEVTGDGVDVADITYTDGGTGTTQNMGEALPWSVEVEPANDVLIYQVMAQNGSNTDGAISCSITIGDEVVAENTSTGVGAIASCDYTP